MRKLVTVRNIADIRPIANADAIECAVVDGWTCVVKKGEFQKGEQGVYFEVDSFLPASDSRYDFLSKMRITWQGKEGVRLRTVRLRGQLSQGLILPLSLFPEVEEFIKNNPSDADVDFTEMLGIEKWEPPISPQLQGVMKGFFPSWISKTDQERCLSADAMIETEDGFLTIKEIVDGELSVKVKSFNHVTSRVEFKNVISFSSVPNKENTKWLKITLKSGRTILMTDNHRVWVAGINKYLEGKDLLVGQKLLISN